MFKTPFKISVVLTIIILVASGIQQGNIKLSSEFLDNFYKSSIRPMIVGEENTGPRPEDTLKAPFKEDEKLVKQSSLDLPYAPPGEEIKKLDIPHRPIEKIADWLVEALSEVFSVDPLEYDKQRVKISQMMDGGAINDFDAFFSKHNILQVLRSNNMLLSGYVEEQPTLIGEKAIEGTYRWVFRVPVTLTMLERNMDSYTGVDLSDSNRNIRLLVRVQLGRVAEGGVDGIEIERMGFKPNSEGQ